MTTTRTTAARLRSTATAYALNTWGMKIRRITAAEVTTMEIRADGYSNAHVEGEHEANGLCSHTGRFAARDCGEAGAAAEFIETTDGLLLTASDLGMSTATPAPRTGAHADCDHASTKAARAACRRQAGKA